MQCFSTMPPYQCQLLGKTQSYVRIFCTGLLGVNFVLLLCLSPLHWVQFVLLKEEKILTGLWTACDNDLCWNHTPKSSYYLHLSRALFLISAFTIFFILIWLSISFTKGPGDKIYVDLGISISSFISGTCLLLCLILFLIQVKLYSRNVLEFQFLLVYYLNWCGSVFYMTVGFLSGFSHISHRVSPPDQNLLVIPMARTRMDNTDSAEAGVNETNVGYFPWMNQTLEKQSNGAARLRTQTEAGTQTELKTQTGLKIPKVLEIQTEPEAQTESEIGDESVVIGLITHARLPTEIERVDIVEPRPEAEITLVDVTSGPSTSGHEGHEKKMT